MKKLSAAQKKRKDELADQLSDAHSELVQVAEKYNVLREQAREFVQEIVDAQEEYYDARSEKWQEGEEGSTYATWREAWEDVLNELEEAIDEAPSEAQVDALVDAPEAVE